MYSTVAPLSSQARPEGASRPPGIGMVPPGGLADYVVARVNVDRVARQRPSAVAGSAPLIGDADDQALLAARFTSFNTLSLPISTSAQCRWKWRWAISVVRRAEHRHDPPHCNAGFGARC